MKTMFNIITTLFEWGSIAPGLTNWLWLVLDGKAEAHVDLGLCWTDWTGLQKAEVSSSGKSASVTSNESASFGWVLGFRRLLSEKNRTSVCRDNFNN